MVSLNVYVFFWFQCQVLPWLTTASKNMACNNLFEEPPCKEWACDEISQLPEFKPVCSFYTVLIALAKETTTIKSGLGERDSEKMNKLVDDLSLTWRAFQD